MNQPNPKNANATKIIDSMCVLSTNVPCFHQGASTSPVAERIQLVSIAKQVRYTPTNTGAASFVAKSMMSALLLILDVLCVCLALVFELRPPRALIRPPAVPSAVNDAPPQLPSVMT